MLCIEQIIYFFTATFTILIYALLFIIYIVNSKSINVNRIDEQMVILCIVATSGGLEGGGLVFKTFTEKNKNIKKVKKINNSDF